MLLNILRYYRILYICICKSASHERWLQAIDELNLILV
jgi:hypothetical protein